MNDLRYYAEEKIREGLAKAAARYGRTFSFPVLRFDLSGRAAGRALCGRNIIRFNAHLFRSNENEFISRTIPHELAHLITWELYGRAEKGHGPYWRSVCRVLGMSDVTRCHSYQNVIPARIRSRAARPFTYRCGCSTPHNLTIIKHRRILMGAVYRCRNCRQAITRV